MTWLEHATNAPESAGVRAIAEQLRAAVDSDVVRLALDAIPAVGGSSHQVDAIVQPHAEELGFSSQRCHICRHAHHLFLIVPMQVQRSASLERVYPRVVKRLATFFADGNETNVRSVAVFGYV